MQQGMDRGEVKGRKVEMQSIPQSKPAGEKGVTLDHDDRKRFKLKSLAFIHSQINDPAASLLPISKLLPAGERSALPASGPEGASP